MTSRFAAHLSSAALASVLLSLALPAQAADATPAAASASQAKARKAVKKASTAKPAKGADSKTVNNNPAGKADDGSNVYGGKKPSGPKFPETQPAAAK